MVARINTSKSLSKVLNYNEHKVRDKEAEILLAQSFLKDADRLSFSDKMRHFERLTSLNERAATNVLHVSLNFDSSEKLENDRLTEIAKTYMERIGFGDQPYLVYRHYDSGHPHVHIVSTNIQHDGSRISMHNLGRNQSEKARKEIETEFGLVKAQEKKLDEAIKLMPINSQKVAYGRSSTKRAISNVLGLVINQYKYSSLAELNAVLNLYNVLADRGDKESPMYEKGGLVYRVLGGDGKSISPPLKASSFYMKPTLKNLEHRFLENEQLKKSFGKRVRTAIDYAFLKTNNMSLKDLMTDLHKQHISVVLRQNKEGTIYGITYVDHKTKCVFNGSDLGKQYSAKAIQERTAFPGSQVSISRAGEKKSIRQSESIIEQPGITYSQTGELKMPEIPCSTAGTPDYIPYQLRKRKQKKKRQIKP